MAANFVFLATVASCMMFAFANKTVPAPVTVDRICLGCICEASSGCDTSGICEGDVCGPFRITWAYWSDGGKPTIDGKPNNLPQSYPECARDPFCSARVIQGYMQKFGQDCNGDKVVDCQDFARIHRLGGFGCGGPLDAKYENAFNNCLATFG